MPDSGGKENQDRGFGLAARRAAAPAGPSLKKLLKNILQSAEYMSMAGNDKRKYPRAETSNLVACVTKDKDGADLGQLIATTLNISQSGVLLGTFQRIESEYIRLTTFDLEDNLIEIKGKVVYCRHVKDGKYEVGINFQGTPDENAQFARKLVHVYNIRKTIFLKDASA